MATAFLKHASLRNGKIFSLDDWLSWIDHMAKNLFGLSGAEFEVAYEQGTFEGSGAADDVASVLPLVRQLRSAKSAEFEAGVPSSLD